MPRRWRRNSSPGTSRHYKDYPEWEADRAYFAIASYKAAVEKAMKAKGGIWPSQDDVIDAMVGLSIESLGGKGVVAQGPYRRPDLRAGPHHPQEQVRLRHARVPFETMYSTDLQKPPGANFWEWIKTAQFKI